MVREYNVVVVGLGIIGSASLWRLSHSSSNVLGIDAGAPINLSGSSHGASRIFRQAYREGEAYLLLLSLSGDLWRELDDTCDRRLIVETGGLFVGPVASGVVRQSVETARRGNIKHKVLSDTEIARSFPAFQVQEGMEGVYEAGAFTIAADDSKCHMLNVAVRQGAELRFGDEISACIEQVFPGLNSTPYAYRKCIYTMSRDGSFIIDEAAHLPGVFYASACSGHGFKFATGLGHLLAKAASSGVLDDSVAIFSAKRFI